jgi:hypothetical protein
MTESKQNTKGQCHCGAVQFEGNGSMLGVDACHCGTCRRLNGGPYMGVRFQDGITLIQSDSLKWYDSSEWARRGFCGQCGASVLYNLKGTEFYAASSGCLDMPTGMAIGLEGFIDEKPDFYNLAGEHPRLTGAEAVALFLKSDDQKDDE